MLRLYLYTWIPLLFFCCTACLVPQRNPWEGFQDDFAYTNRLIDEKSPYLRRSAHQPMNWHPWGLEALSRAEEEGKLIFLHIGYATNHFCHDMDRNTFNDTTVAGLVNQYFIPIKIDLEERPDIYQYFLKACELLNKGSCEIPMNIVCLSNGNPIFAGSYYDKQTFQEMVSGVLGWNEAHSQDVRGIGQSMKQNLQIINLLDQNQIQAEYSFRDLTEVFYQLQSYQELPLNAPYPTSYSIKPALFTYLLRYMSIKRDVEGIKTIEEVLEKYIWSVNYDQFGGGFFSGPEVEQPYKVYFEKNLDYNAQLISLYSELYQITQNPVFEQVIYESINFIERELASIEGGMYASVDAESETINGRYYTWELFEFEELFRGNSRLIADYYNIVIDGNWQSGENVLFRTKPDDFFAQKYHMNEISFRAKIEQLRQLGFKAKKSRARPTVDKRRFTAWNAKMISAYLQAYRTIEEKNWFNKAVEHGEFLWSHCSASEGKLFHTYLDGKGYGEASLDDYASCIEAFFSLYQMSFDEVWLARAEELMEYLTVYFGDNESGMFFLMPYEYEGTIIPQIPIKDQSDIATNAHMCKLLMELGILMDRLDYRQRAKKMLDHIKFDLLDQPEYHTYWALAMMDIIYPPLEIVVIGKDYKNLRNGIMREHLPHVLFLGSSGMVEKSSIRFLRLFKGKVPSDQTFAYVCRDSRYQRPVQSSQEAIDLIHTTLGF